MQLAGVQQVAIPGILGGLGPLAHIELEKRLLQQQQQRIEIHSDQDYPVWLMIAGTQIPDRTRSFTQTGPCCISALQQHAQLLQKMGSDFLIVPCNTAHAFYPQVQAAIDIPWLHLMDCTTRCIDQQYPALKRVGILATDGTLQASLYAASLRQAGLIPIQPAVGSSLQEQVMQSIYAPQWGIKTTGTQISSTALEILRQAVGWLKKRGAELVIAGCTELSVAFERIDNLPLPWVDPLRAIADLALACAYGDRPLVYSVA